MKQVLKMTYNPTYPKANSVYPGEYVPPPEKEVLLEGLKISGIDSAVQPPLLNMEELKDCFKIEVLIPGVKRENIFTYIENNILSIIVLGKHGKELKIKQSQIHEFDTEYLQRNILLPNNADAEFISSEYKEGVLSIYISKGKKPSNTNTQPILIY
jgi:HSP20 family molecular chaperone IbpA